MCSRMRTIVSDGRAVVMMIMYNDRALTKSETRKVNVK